MSKKLILVFAIIVFLTHSNKALANISISEVLYSPTTKQWVEIYNDGDASVDISKYKILDSGATVNGHGFTAISGGTSVPAHGYAIVAKNPDDFSSASVPVLKSPLNIKVSLDEIILRNEFGEDVSSVDIDGIAVDGNSFQYVGGSWVSATPTPGRSNSASTGGNDNDDGNDTDNADTSSTSTASTDSSGTTQSATKKIQKIKVQISTITVAHVGIPFGIEGTGTGIYGETLTHGRYYWNFGDGDFREVKVVNTDKFSHTYYYPGEYSLTLEYYPDSFADEPDAVAQMNIKVIEPNIIISRVGGMGDFFIEITNETSNNADLSNWVITSANRIFTLPRNTFLASKKKMIIPPHLSGFTILDKDSLKLLTSQKEIAFEFGAPTKKVSSSGTINKSVNSKSQNVDKADSEILDLSASVLGAGNSAKESGTKFSTLFFVGFAILLAGAGFAVYKIRQRDPVPAPEADFEILDE